MPRFITIGYGDDKGYQQTDKAVRDAAHAHDESLKQRGVVMGIAGEPVQVRNPDGAGVKTTRGAFLEARLPAGRVRHPGSGLARRGGAAGREVALRGRPRRDRGVAARGVLIGSRVERARVVGGRRGPCSTRSSSVRSGSTTQALLRH